MEQINIFELMEKQFSEASFPVLLADLDLNITYCNDAAEAISRTLLFMDGIRLMIPQEELETCRQKLRDGYSSRLFTSPLHAVTTCLSVTPLRESQQVVGAFITLAPDTILPQTVEEAVEGVSSAALSGSFRHPLSQIFASLAVILRKLHASDNHTVDQPLQTINQSAYLILRNLNNMVSRINFYSSSKPDLQTVDIWERLGELLEATDIALRAGGYRLNYALPPGQACVRCIFQYISIALLNIISNACKASTHGSSIVVTGRTAEEHVIITVTDNGCGIPQNKIDHLFDPFFSWRHGEAPTLGLGLSVTKQIIYEAGGTLAVNSQEGEGTSVAFTLPLVEEPPQQRLPMECSSSSYLLDHFSPVYWVLADVIPPPSQ